MKPVNDPAPTSDAFVHTFHPGNHPKQAAMRPTTLHMRSIQMSITTQRILCESVISLAQAARRLPGTRENQRVHPSTILRWITRGTRTLDGRTVRLEGCRCGYRWVTSVEALDRYTSTLTDASTPNASHPPGPQSPPAHRRAQAKTDKRLDELLS